MTYIKKLIFIYSRPTIFLICAAMWLTSLPVIIEVNSQIRHQLNENIQEKVNAPKLHIEMKCDELTSDKQKSICTKEKERLKKLDNSKERMEFIDSLNLVTGYSKSPLSIITKEELATYDKNFTDILIFDYGYSASKEQGEKLKEKLDQINSSKNEANDTIIKSLQTIVYPLPILFWLIMFTLNLVLNKEQTREWRKENRSHYNNLSNIVKKVK